jgi:Squalene/phytoene synthase
MSTPQHPSAPAPGSRRYLTLLYTPPSQRDELHTLLALADEIGSAPSASVDHSIAHVRLEWWRQEAQRFARGEPQHPWLRSLLAAHPTASGLDLQALVEAAALDLATRTLASQSGHALRRALFELAAHALCVQPLPPAQRAIIGEFGAHLERLENDASDESARTVLQQQLQQLGQTLQPALAPLLVWLALAARRSHRRPALLDSLTDNLIAWSAARRAARGRFQLQ